MRWGQLSVRDGAPLNTPSRTSRSASLGCAKRRNILEATAAFSLLRWGERHLQNETAVRMMSRAFWLSCTAVAVFATAACSRHDGPQAVASRGAVLYEKNCAACHGQRGNGPIGPSLAQIRKRRTADQITEIIRNPDPPMPKLYPHDLSDSDIADLTAFVETL